VGSGLPGQRLPRVTCPEGFGTPGHFPARIDVAPVVVVDGPDKDKFELEAAFNS
jgi:hypothetical protein